MKVDSIDTRLTTEETTRATADTSLQTRVSTLDSGFTDGQLLIGKSDGSVQKATLTDGSGIEITNSSGNIKITNSLQVEGTALGGTGDVTHNYVHKIIFISGDGMTAQSDASGVVRVGLGSHWKKLEPRADGGEVSGPDIEPSGEETLRLKAGNNIKLTTDSTQPQSVKFEVVIDADDLTISQVSDLQTTLNTQSTSVVTLSSESVRDIGSLDTKLSSRISTESSTRVVKDNSLDTKISTESSTREVKDDSLNTKISTESSTRVSKVDSIDTRVGSEETTRESHDSLNTKISTESSTRLVKDDSLNTKISTESSTRVVKVTSIDTRFGGLDSNLDNRQH